jgi:hypothetical protein
LLWAALTLTWISHHGDTEDTEKSENHVQIDGPIPRFTANSYDPGLSILAVNISVFSVPPW